MEAVCFSETVATTYQTMRYHSPEDSLVTCCEIHRC